MVYSFLLAVLTFASPQEAKDYADSLFSKSLTYLRSDLDSCYLLASQGYDIAREYSYTYGLAQNAFVVGRVQDKKRLYKSATIKYMESLRHYNNSKNTRPDQQLQIIKNLGRIYRSYGFYDDALNLADSAYRIAVSLGSEKEKARLLYNKGVAMRYQNDFERASEFFIESLKIAQDIDYVSKEAQVRDQLGQCYIKLGNTEEAKNYLFEIINYKGEGIPDITLGNAYHNIGWCYLEDGELVKAESYFLKALDLFEEDQNENIYVSKMDLGDAYLQMGKKEEARKLWDEALDIYNPETNQEYFKIYKLYAQSYRVEDWGKFEYYMNLHSLTYDKFIEEKDRLKNIYNQDQQEFKQLIDAFFGIQKRQKQQEREFWQYLLAGLTALSLSSLAFVLIRRKKRKIKGASLIDRKWDQV